VLDRSSRNDRVGGSWSGGRRDSAGRGKLSRLFWPMVPERVFLGYRPRRRCHLLATLKPSRWECCEMPVLTERILGILIGCELVDPSIWPSTSLGRISQRFGAPCGKGHTWRPEVDQGTGTSHALAHSCSKEAIGDGGGAGHPTEQQGSGNLANVVPASPPHRSRNVGRQNGPDARAGRL